MKNKRSLFLSVLAGIAGISFSGCGQAYDTDNYGPSVYIQPSHNFLGIVKTTPESFIPVPPTTFDIHSSEISAVRDYSGDNIQLFWGAFTFTDY
ncbi:MAG: hypothetical protein LBV54_05880 [Puniceicoccales bacterium]|jgi:hypothetical protein|nr:hypothetical protein [Puniceicoccales bacterium]